MEEQYTVEEFAVAVRISPATVRRWCGDGLIRAVKMGKKWRIAKSEVERVLREGVAPELETPARAGKSN